VLPGSDGLFAPRLSPGGRYVAASSLSQSRLLLFDFMTRKWMELARFKRMHNPAWSRDERFRRSGIGRFSSRLVPPVRQRPLRLRLGGAV